MSTSSKYGIDLQNYQLNASDDDARRHNRLIIVQAVLQLIHAKCSNGDTAHLSSEMEYINQYADFIQQALHLR